MLNKITSQFQLPINKRPLTPPLSGQNPPSFHPGALTQDTVTLSRAAKPRFGATISENDKQRAMEAAKTGDIATLHTLHVQYNGAIEFVQMKDEAGKTIWHHAAENQHRAILEALFHSYGSNRASNIRDTVRNTGRNLVESENAAVRVASVTPPVMLPLVASLAGSAAYLYFNPILNVDEKDNKGQTALCLAAKEGNGPVVEFLLEKGADPNCADNKNRGPRDWAIQNGHYQVSRQIREAQITKIENTRERKVKEPLSQLCVLQDRKEKMHRVIEQQSDKLAQQKKFIVKSKKKKATQNRTVQRKILDLNFEIDRLQRHLLRMQHQLTQEQTLSQQKDGQIQNLNNNLTAQQLQNQQQAGKIRNKNRFIVRLKRTRVKHNRNTQRKIRRFNRNIQDLDNIRTLLITQQAQDQQQMQGLNADLTNRLQQIGILNNQLNTQQTTHQQQVNGFQNQIGGLTNQLTTQQNQNNNLTQQLAQSQQSNQQKDRHIETLRSKNKFKEKKYPTLKERAKYLKELHDVRQREIDANKEIAKFTKQVTEQEREYQRLQQEKTEISEELTDKTNKHKNSKKILLRMLKRNNIPIPESISPLSSDDESSSEDYATPRGVSRSVSPNPEASTSAQNKNASNSEQSPGEVHSENSNTTQGSKKRERFIVRGRRHQARRKPRHNPARGNSYSAAEIAATVVESLQNMIPGLLRNPSPSRSRTPSPPPRITETAQDDRALMTNLLDHYERYSQQLRGSISALQEQIGTQRNQHTQRLHQTVTDYEELLQDIQNQRDQLRTQRDNQALNFQAQSSSQQLQFQQHLDQVRADYQQQLDTLHARYQQLSTQLPENEEERPGRSSNRSEQGERSRSESLAGRIARHLLPQLLPIVQQNDIQQNIMTRVETLVRDQQFHRNQQQRNQQRRGNGKSWIPRILRRNNNI